MATIARPNCIHIDNRGRCKIHKSPWWAFWLKGRDVCKLYTSYIPQDGTIECDDQVKNPRPAPPKYIKDRK